MADRLIQTSSRSVYGPGSIGTVAAVLKITGQ